MLGWIVFIITWFLCFRYTYKAYYQDMKLELIARKAFPNSSQNKKRIQTLEKDLKRLGRRIEQ